MVSRLMCRVFVPKLDPHRPPVLDVALKVQCGSGFFPRPHREHLVGAELQLVRSSASCEGEPDPAVLTSLQWRRVRHW